MSGGGTRGRGWLRLAYPALLAAIPVLSRHAENLGHARTLDALWFAAAVAVATVLVQAGCYGLLRLALRRPAPGLADWAALGGAAFVGLFYKWPRFSDWAHPAAAQHPGTALGVAALAVAAALAALWWGARRGGARRVAPALAPAGQFATLAAALVAGWSAARIAIAPARDAGLVRRSALVRTLAQPVPVTRPPAAGPLHDVYVMLLDGYPSAESLRDVFGIDDRPFLDSLRALGFRIPARLRSNYPASLLSINSLLNFAHVRPLADEAPEGYRSYAFAAALLEDNRAARFLKARGYRFAFFESGAYAPTRHNRLADVEFPRPDGLDPARTIYRSNLLSGFADGTILRSLLRYAPTRQEYTIRHLDRTFADVAALARRPSGGPPVYAMAHLLLPHAPFVADSLCRAYPRGYQYEGDEIPPDQPQVRAAVAQYVACANRRVLATVRAILARPGQRPIILVQGDHGQSGLGIFDVPVDSITQAQVRERYSPLGAYYLPDGGAAAMPDTTSIVNVLRTVFSYYYGADLPPLPNAMYYSHFWKPYRMTPVDTLRLLPTLGPASGTLARQPVRQGARPAQNRAQE